MYPYKDGPEADGSAAAACCACCAPVLRWPAPNALAAATPSFIVFKQHCLQTITTNKCEEQGVHGWRALERHASQVHTAMPTKPNTRHTAEHTQSHQHELNMLVYTHSSSRFLGRSGSPESDRRGAAGPGSGGVALAKKAEGSPPHEIRDASEQSGVSIWVKRAARAAGQPPGVGAHPRGSRARAGRPTHETNKQQSGEPRGGAGNSSAARRSDHSRRTRAEGAGVAGERASNSQGGGRPSNQVGGGDLPHNQANRGSGMAWRPPTACVLHVMSVCV